MALEAVPIAGVERAQHLMQLPRDRPDASLRSDSSVAASCFARSRGASFGLDRSLKVRLTGVIAISFSGVSDDGAAEFRRRHVESA
jgi:hypothetical protein